MDISETRFLRLPEVIAQSGLSRSNIYNQMTAGRFPLNKKLGDRISVWLSSDIDDWKQSQIDEWEAKKHPKAL
jgi:prophage regulatory protein